MHHAAVALAARSLLVRARAPGNGDALPRLKEAESKDESTERVLVSAFLMVPFTTVPAFAVQNGGSCYACNYVYDPGNPMGSQGYCGNPQSGDWGYEQCRINWATNCITSGDMCYYIEVRPR